MVLPMHLKGSFTRNSRKSASEPILALYAGMHDCSLVSELMLW